MSKQTSPDQKIATCKLEVYYDGNCPICNREINFLKEKTPTVKYSDYNSGCNIGKSHQELDARIHARLADGTVISGMEVFRKIYSETKFGWLLAPTGWKLLKPIFDFCYELFARNRHNISRKLIAWKILS